LRKGGYRRTRHARRLGADYLLVRTSEDAAQVDAMILPGGEAPPC
jgi:glutamine amidotransferase PdxT